MSKASVIVEGVSKKFGLSVKAALKYGLVDSGRRLLGRGNDHRLRPGEFWALKDIDLRLEPGDALGIMGVNGSGKTTLLRILNGTYSPDAGQVTMRGRIGALIAAGAGFSPMLSGRENIHISGTLVGMTPAEIRQKFDEIVDFAELGDFLDMPVRNYSSGMSVRLGFAIAVIGTPEILLVDEVLAVGDISFQKKCFERIQRLKQQGTTILLVSHSPGSIWAVCDKGIVIHRGHSRGVTSVEEACKEYETNNAMERLRHPRSEAPENLPSDYGGARGGTGTAFITRIEVMDPAGVAIESIEYARDFILRCNIEIRQSIREAILRVQVDAEINKSIAIIDSYELHRSFLSLDPGIHIIDIRINRPQLRPGVYSFSGSIIDKNVGVHLFFEYDQARILVRQSEDKFFYADFRASVQLDATYSLAGGPEKGFILDTLGQ